MLIGAIGIVSSGKYCVVYTRYMYIMHVCIYVQYTLPQNKYNSRKFLTVLAKMQFMAGAFDQVIICEWSVEWFAMFLIFTLRYTRCKNQMSMYIHPISLVRCSDMDSHKCWYIMSRPSFWHSKAYIGWLGYYTNKCLVILALHSG